MQKYGKANLCVWLAKLAAEKPKNIIEAMQPIDDAPGSRFGEDVIRITGSDEFCEAVLSRVADLIEIERADGTRLDCSWSEIKDDERFAKGAGKNSIYLRMALRRVNNSPMSLAHQSVRSRY